MFTIDKLKLFFSALTMLSFALPAQAADDWKFEFVPYAWLSGIEADVTAGEREVDVDVDFDDLFDAFEIGGSFLAVTQYKQFVLWTQLDYFELDSNNLDNAPERARIESDALFVTTALGYQFHTFGESTIDVLGGVRYLDLENSLTVDGLGSGESSQDIVDGVIVLRPSLPLLSWLRLNPTFSIGTGDSDLTYELQPQAQVHFTETVVARLGYRRLFYDVDGPKGEFDGSFHGFLLGVGVEF